MAPAAGPHPELVALAHRLADAAAEVQRRYFRTPISVDTKADESPVTIADREAEAVIRELIAAAFPDHGILGEEHGRERLEAEHVWVIDPIDGTKSFIAGRPLFGTLIALLREGRPILGIIDQSILRERWIGVAGEASQWNGQPIRTRSCARLEEATLFSTSPRMFQGGAERDAIAAIEERVRTPIYGGDCYAYGLLAAGFGDLCVEAGLQVYDYMALVPVIEGAGGRLSDWRGHDLQVNSSGQALAAGDMAVHAQALRHLEPAAL